MAKIQGSERPAGGGTVEVGRTTTDYLTTYYHGRVELLHACGKTVHVPSGRVSDGLYVSHVCGPIGSPWDSAHVTPTDATEPQRRRLRDAGVSTVGETVAIVGLVACMYGLVWVFAQ